MPSQRHLSSCPSTVHAHANSNVFWSVSSVASSTTTVSGSFGSKSGGGLGADPRELPEVDALRRALRLEGHEHVDGRVEHAVDEAEGRELVELARPLLRHLVVAGELGDPLGRETEPTQATDELDDLRTGELRSEVLTGHGDLPFL